MKCTDLGFSKLWNRVRRPSIQVRGEQAAKDDSVARRELVTVDPSASGPRIECCHSGFAKEFRPLVPRTEQGATEMLGARSLSWALRIPKEGNVARHGTSPRIRHS